MELTRHFGFNLIKPEQPDINEKYKSWDMKNWNTTLITGYDSYKSDHVWFNNDYTESKSKYDKQFAYLLR